VLSRALFISDAGIPDGAVTLQTRQRHGHVIQAGGVEIPLLRRLLLALIEKRANLNRG
jgi:hypothetical protein